MKREVEETELRAIFASSPDAITVSDLDGNITDCNQATLDMGGFSSKDEVLGKSAFEFIAEKDRERAMENLKKTLEQGSVKNVEYSFLAKDGREFPAELSASVIKDSSGNPTGFVAIMKDITERKKAEEALKKSEEKYRNLFENARDVIITFDLKGNVTSINKTAVEYGFKKDEIVGKSLLKFVSEKYWPRLLKELAKIARGTSMEGEIEIITPKGKKIAEYRSNPIRLGKKVVGFQTIMRDITERKKMEKQLKEYAEHLEEMVGERTRELRKSEERYSSIVNDAIDSLESGILILDKDFKVFWINKAIEKFFGLNRDSLIGVDKRKAIKEKIKYVFEDPERFEKTVLATYNDNTYVENFECHVLPSRDKEERFLVHWSTPIKTGAYAGGRIEHYYDVTKLKQMEQHLLKSERMAAIGEVATMVGHDLRNPLQSIENATYYLNNELPRLPPLHPNPTKSPRNAPSHQRLSQLRRQDNKRPTRFCSREKTHIQKNKHQRHS